MKRKILFITLFLFLTFGLCLNSFATGNMVNDIRNTVGGAENVVENGVRDVTGSMNRNDNNTNTGSNNNMMGTGSANTYDVARTSTAGTTTDAGFGLTSNMWTWVILAIVGVGIIALVWSYNSDNSKHD